MSDAYSELQKASEGCSHFPGFINRGSREDYKEQCSYAPVKSNWH